MNVVECYIPIFMFVGVREMDPDLTFMAQMPEEQLQVFVETLIEKGGLTETLSVSDEYKKYGKNYAEYWSRIEKEYRDFGSNTITSVFSGANTYREILVLVLKQCNVNYDSSYSIENMEELLLESIIKNMWEKLSKAERIALLSDLKDDVNNIDFNSIGGITSSLLIQIFRAGGFASYKITLIIVNAIAKAILGRGLSLAANAGIVKGISVLVGPIGMIVTALWSVYDLAGPAYRVIIPCTILIAAYRKMELTSSNPMS